MTSTSPVKQLVEAGIHFGQRRSNWNPKMKPYIFGERNKIHIIDIRETIKGILLAQRFIEKTVATGQDVCFVGTKRQARGSIERMAKEAGMPYVSERWLGGTLTNFRTIRERLGRLMELEELVNSGEIETYSKKMTSQLLREKRKITRNLDGIRNMKQLPGALVVIDVKHELNSIREARILGIPTICLIDTDGDPDLADIPIPGNDDSMRSIECVLSAIVQSVKRGVEGRTVPHQAEEEGADESAPQQRSSRATFQANPEPPAPGTAVEEAPADPAGSSGDTGSSKTKG